MLYHEWPSFSNFFRYLSDYNITTRSNYSSTKFYKRFVDDLINKRQKNQPDTLFERLNNHIHISYTIEGSPKKSLDITIINNNGIITTEANHKEIKLPVHWSSTIPKRNNRNTIGSYLNRTTGIASVF